MLHPRTFLMKSRAKKLAKILEENYYTLSTTGDEAVEIAWDEFERGLVTDEYLANAKISKIEYLAAIEYMYISLKKEIFWIFRPY